MKKITKKTKKTDGRGITVWVSGEQDALGRRRTGRFSSRVGRRRSLAGVRERETRQRGREREARRRVRGRGRGAGWTGWTMDLVGALPGLREKWEREGENERDGGK
jgi:hypothetical protein